MTPSEALARVLDAREDYKYAPYGGTSRARLKAACADFDQAIYDAAVRAKNGIVPGVPTCTYCSRVRPCTAANCPLAGS